VLRIPHNRLIDGCEVGNPTHRPRSTLQKPSISASSNHICQRLRKPQGLVPLEGLRKLKKFIHLNGSRTRNLPACRIVPQSLRYRVLPSPTTTAVFEVERLKEVTEGNFYVTLLVNYRQDILCSDLKLKLKLKLICDRQSVGQFVWVSGLPMGPLTRF
jgi:hypothetical protein